MSLKICNNFRHESISFDGGHLKKNQCPLCAMADIVEECRQNEKNLEEQVNQYREKVEQKELRIKELIERLKK